MSLMRDYINIVEAKNRPSKLVLEKLPYKTADLAPVLSQDNVEYHYNVLSNGYVDRYNNKEGDPDFNYGGAMLHNIFWQQLQAPRGTNKPTGAIKELIEEKHKSFADFLDAMIIKSMSIQGSGWVYLAKNGEIKTTPNQSYRTDILLPVDMWEHSFMDYMPAKDAKKKYITAVMRIVNWSVINDRLNNKG
jgi:superoxide dismutase, Fe-Mn family